MSSAHLPIDGSDISILIVDDAKFTCEMLRRALKGAGYVDIRVANSARQSLEQMKERSADILLADWLMPEMDGLTLTERVRQLDEEHHHYTYVILLTAKEGTESLTEAFAHGVDDFISKSPDNTELLARIRGATRIALLQNDLLRANQRLLEMSRERERAEWFDGLTGLPNRGFLDHQIDRMLRHVESRGGHACLVMARITGLDAIRKRYGDDVADQICIATGARLQQAVRPLDWITRINDSDFAMLLHQEDGDGCHPHAFKRLHQALNLRAYRTDAGFINVTAAVSLLPLPPKRGIADSDAMLERCSEGLDVSAVSANVHLVSPLHRS